MSPVAVIVTTPVGPFGSAAAGGSGAPRLGRRRLRGDDGLVSTVHHDENRKPGGDHDRAARTISAMTRMAGV